MAWQGIVSSPDVAKENKHQIVETEHLMKSLLEQKNGLARRIFSKVGVDNTRLLDATDKFIQRQPKVVACSATIYVATHLLQLLMLKMLLYFDIVSLEVCRSFAAVIEY